MADDGMPAIRSGNIVECGLRPGYFRSAYERIVPSATRPRPGARTSRSPGAIRNVWAMLQLLR